MQQKRFRSLMMAAGLLAGGMLSAGLAHADPGHAKMLADTCAGCHGTNGNANGPAMPSIAGMPQEQMVALLKEFRNGSRPNTIMGRLMAPVKDKKTGKMKMRGYSDSEIEMMAHFFSMQKFVPAQANGHLKHANGQPVKYVLNVDPAKAAKGKSLAKKCKKCHGLDGVDPDNETSRLGGQWLDYLLIQMQNYKHNPEGYEGVVEKKMRKGVKKMSAADLENLSHFYASQK